LDRRIPTKDELAAIAALKDDDRAPMVALMRSGDVSPFALRAFADALERKPRGQPRKSWGERQSSDMALAASDVPSIKGLIKELCGRSRGRIGGGTNVHEFAVWCAAYRWFGDDADAPGKLANYVKRGGAALK
jgi:hypothetical protein